MSEPKTVIITGASSGIGFALTRAYIARGDQVVANGRSLERLQQAAKQLGNPANLLLVAGDIGKAETAARLFDQAIRHFGQVDILINNAGIFISKPAVDYRIEDIDNMLTTNLRGFLYPTQQAAKHMSARGSGHIITITAAIAMQPNTAVPALLPVMVKGGLNSAIRALAVELAANNVMVNGVAPGVIATPMHPQQAEIQQLLANLAPTKRIGTTTDVVNAVMYLSDANFVTGTILPVDGGSTAGIWSAG